MKKLITDIDLLRINTARKDALKFLGAMQPEERQHGLSIIKYMVEKWTDAIKQSNTKVDINQAKLANLTDEQICEVEKLEAHKNMHIESINRGYRDFSDMRNDEEMYNNCRLSNDRYVAEKLAWIKIIEDDLQKIWGKPVVQYEFADISSIKDLVEEKIKEIQDYRISMELLRKKRNGDN